MSQLSPTKRKTLNIQRNKPVHLPKGVTSVVGYGSLLKKLLAKLPEALKAMKQANEAHEKLLKKVIDRCDIGAKGDSEFALTVPDCRGELYYVEKRLRQEREMRALFLIGDVYTVLLFCKNLIPPSREMVIKAKSIKLKSIGDAIQGLTQRLDRAKELYSIKMSELAIKHAEQLKRQQQCVRIMRKLLSKENNYVNILHIADNNVTNVHNKGKVHLSKTTPDLAKELRRVVERHIQIYMQQRDRGIVPSASTLSKADEHNRTKYVPGKSTKLDELRYTMEQLAARVVPPGIQIKELASIINMRSERISKVDQMDSKSREAFQQVNRNIKRETNVAINSKALLTIIAEYLADVIKELLDMTNVANDKRNIINNKLEGLTIRIKEKKEECRPFKKFIRQYRPEIISLREDMVILSQVEAQLRCKLRMLLEQLSDLEKQRVNKEEKKGQHADEGPIYEEEVRLHHSAIEKVEIRTTCIENDRRIKDLLDLINRKRCHIKLQIGHLNKEMSILMDEIDSRNSTHDLFAADNARLEKYVTDNEKFLKTVEEAIEACNKRAAEGGEVKEVEDLEHECEELNMTVEKLVQTPEEYYPAIRELEREIDAIRSRCREKNRNLHKLETAMSRRRELQQEIKTNQAAPDQLPNLIERDLQAVMEELKALQGKFEEVFNKNIELKHKMIEQESLIDRHRRNIGRLETDITVKEIELDKQQCQSLIKEHSDTFYKKYQLEKGKQLSPSPPPPPPPPPPPSSSVGPSSHYTSLAPSGGPSGEGTPTSSAKDARHEWKKLYEQCLQAGPDTGVGTTRADDREIYVEEVRVKTTRTIRASPGFLFVHGLQKPLSDLDKSGWKTSDGDQQQTTTETVRPLSKDERVQLLLTETKIPESTARKPDEESPELPWVSYTDGRDIPTVLKTSLDQGTSRLLQRIKKVASTSMTTPSTSGQSQTSSGGSALQDGPKQPENTPGSPEGK